MPPGDLRCLTWNVHRGRGRDGRIDPDRTLRTLIEEVWHEGCEVLALTEADAEARPHHGFLNLAAVETGTGLRHAQADRALRWSEQSHGFLGSVVLFHPSIRVIHAEILDLPGVYHRGACIFDLQRDEQRFRLIVTHLSLSQVLRIAQMRTIGQYLHRRPEQPTILIGDLNEWRPWGGLAFARQIVGHPLTGPAKASFPAARPFLPLDRVMCTPPARVLSLQTLRSEAILETSDHLPLIADIDLYS
ncbi:endonuclease/exonuclease/phosphatase family protein [Halovulum sp. GXIMD14794]